MHRHELAVVPSFIAVGGVLSALLAVAAIVTPVPRLAPGAGVPVLVQLDRAPICLLVEETRGDGGVRRDSLVLLSDSSEYFRPGWLRVANPDGTYAFPHAWMPVSGDSLDLVRYHGPRFRFSGRDTLGGREVLPETVTWFSEALFDGHPAAVPRIRREKCSDWRLSAS